MSVRAKREYVQAIYARYRRARRPDKGRILDEFCAITRCHRKHALRVLNGPAPGAEHPPRHRPVQYGPAVIEALRAIWEAAGYPWSLRLKALLPLWLPWARRRLRLRPAMEQQLQAISPRQIDRRLAPHRRQLKKRRYGWTKPGSLLKHHITLRTDRWDVAVPGFTEIDLVAHCGSLGDGEFVHSLNVTDIHTTWVETASVLGKSQVAVQAALEEVRQALPFRLRGIDSDNGSEFINQHLWDYCQAQEIQFTRGRPYKKDDNAADFTLKHRLPAISMFRAFSEGGGLMSYGPNRREYDRRLALYVDKILKGAKPGDLPIEQPTHYELVINLKTAKALGLTIPPSLLQRADQVIE